MNLDRKEVNGPCFSLFPLYLKFFPIFTDHLLYRFRKRVTYSESAQCKYSTYTHRLMDRKKENLTLENKTK